MNICSLGRASLRLHRFLYVYILSLKKGLLQARQDRRKKHQHTAKAIFQPKKLGPFVLEQPAGIIVFILAW